MNHEAISQIFFDEWYTVPPGQTARSMFRFLPHARDYAERLVDAMATGYLVAVLESICAKALQPSVDADAETVVGAHVDCRHCGPIAPGATIRVTGWVETLGEREVVFRVQARDDHEQVCDGAIRLCVVPRERMSAIIARKQRAAEQRRLFAPA